MLDGFRIYSAQIKNGDVEFLGFTFDNIILIGF